MMSLCGSNRLTSFSAAGTVSPLRTRRSVCSITCSTKGSQEPTEASQASTSMPAHAGGAHPGRGGTQIAHGRAGDGDQVSIQHRPLGLLAAMIDGLGTPLGPPGCDYARQWPAPAADRRRRPNRRTMIRMASHKSQLSLGSWIIVSVTVLSRRSSVPVSTLVLAGAGQ